MTSEKVKAYWKQQGKKASLKKIFKEIDVLWTFFDCDMYTKFRPEIKIGKRTMYRQDWFTNEKEFSEYLKSHFELLKKIIKER